MIKELSFSWETVAESISEGKTVVFVGPGVTINYRQPDKSDTFFKNLCVNNSDKLHEFNTYDGLLFYRDPEASIDIAPQVRKFYNQTETNPLAEKLAALPFHLYTMLTPDTCLSNAFAKQQFAQPKTEYFDMLNLREIEQIPTVQNPLIYHLFGISNNANSLVISHTDLFKYMKAFYGGSNLASAIKSCFNQENTNHLLFLGVDFDKWYFQLILNFLEIDFKKFKRYSLNDSVNQSDLQQIWEKHFRISFISGEMDLFIDTLYNHFAAQNLLRKKSETATVQKKYIIANILKLITLSFDSTSLTSFCMCYYPEVQEQFADEMPKSGRINLLLDFVKRHDRFDELIALVKDENIVQWEKNKPYTE